MKTTVKRGSRRALRAAGRTMEVLEERRLLSGTVVEPLLTLAPSATTYSSGYTPAQISKAYGFNLVNGNGSGQTIAIVDAYRDPNAAADLHVFDQQFGLGDPNLTIVNQTGGSAGSVAVNSGWSTETALDIEWAHAMAPQAKILLVEANSANLITRGMPRVFRWCR
jgi:subtilase family serine protease